DLDFVSAVCCCFPVGVVVRCGSGGLVKYWCCGGESRLEWWWWWSRFWCCGGGSDGLEVVSFLSGCLMGCTHVCTMGWWWLRRI
ncbi:hypothetical protein A2U01_0079107, partial [Trifolium medium]|nr:hypothetical protein [Trifolium medium]